MKIAYHYHHEIQKHKNKYYCNQFWGKWVFEISKHTKLNLIAWIKEVDKKPSLYLLNTQNISFTNLGEKPSSFINHFFNLYKVKKIISNYDLLKKVDYIGFEVPTFYAVYIWFWLNKKKFFVFLAGDMPKIVLTATSTPVLKRYILFLYYLIDKFFLIKLCNQSIVFDENYKTSNRSLKNNEYDDYYKKIKTTRHNMLMTTFYGDDVYFKRKQDFLPNKKPILVYIGRLETGNEIFKFIEIAEFLSLKTKNFKWYILGDGPDGDLFKNKIKNKNLSKFFKFFGHIEHGKKFSEIVKKCDIYVDPYNPAGPGPGRAGWEAFAYGLVSVAGTSSKKDYFIHGKNIYHPKNNSNLSFSEAIYDIINDNKKRAIISKNASKIAKTRSLDNEVKRLISVLKRKKSY